MVHTLEHQELLEVVEVPEVVEHQELLDIVELMVHRELLDWMVHILEQAEHQEKLVLLVQVELVLMVVLVLPEVAVVVVHLV
jgi:hypothetical protein